MLKRFLILAIIALCVTSTLAAAPAHVRVLRVEGAIDPAVADYLKDGIESAGNSGAQAVLVVLDTPGGLISSMKVIVQSMFSSRVPVIVYVYPEGAWAASAGALITMAGDIAAMAPGSSIGASTPVSISPGGGTEKMDDTMKRKEINFTSEYAKSIAEKRGRNVKWADAAVRQAASLTADKALQGHVIDYVASSISELMRKVDGRAVKLSDGRTVTLHTAGTPLEERPMSSWDTLLHVLSDPYVTLFLTLHGDVRDHL